MKVAVVATLLLGAHAASYSGASQPGGEAPGSLATQPGVAATTVAQAGPASAAASGAAPQHPGNVTELMLREVEAVNARVLAYGGGDPAALFDAAKGLVALVQDLTRVLNGTKASVPAAAAPAPPAASASSAAGARSSSSAPPITRASFASTGAGDAGPGPAMRQAIELLLRDIDETKWAFQLGSVCEIMYFVVGKIGESFHELLATIVAQAPAADHVATNQTMAGADAAFRASQALLGPRYCVNANPQGPAFGNGSAHGRHPAVPLPGFRFLGGPNGTNASWVSSSSAAGTAQPTRLDGPASNAAAVPSATNDRAQGAAAETTVSGDAAAATAGAAAGFRVPVAAAWGFLLAVPGLLL